MADEEGSTTTVDPDAPPSIKVDLYQYAREQYGDVVGGDDPDEGPEASDDDQQSQKSTGDEADGQKHEPKPDGAQTESDEDSQPGDGDAEESGEDATREELEEEVARLRKQIGRNSRVHRDNNKLRKEITDLQDQIRSIREKQERANLPDWHEDSPNFEDTMDRFSDVETMVRQLRSTTDEEERVRIANDWATNKGVSEQDVRNYRAYQRDQKRRSDPRRRAKEDEERLRRIVQEEQARSRQESDERRALQGLFEQNKDLVDKYGKAGGRLEQLLEDGYHPAYALSMLRNEELELRIRELESGTQTATAQLKHQRATARGKARQERSPETAVQTMDPDEAFTAAKRRFRKEYNSEPNTASPQFQSMVQEIVRRQGGAP